jgi:membrane protease YdiL (CAAX protease family)
MLGAVAVYGIAALIWWPARDVGGFTLGRAGPADALLALGTGVVSSGVLAAWLLFAKPDLSDLVSRIPRLGWPALILAGLLFALVNSVVEEVLFRGLLWAGLVESLRSSPTIVIAQAACFGAAHFRGFPRGGSGVALAFTYGLLLGIVRRRTGGILWPILGHVLPDLTIFILVALEAGAGAGLR